MTSARLARPPAMVAPKSFVERLRGLAEQRGDAPGITFVDSHDPAGVISTYASLDGRARAIAAVLQECATPGDRAVLMLRSGPAYVSAFFGCLYAGVVPAPAFSPEARRDQHQARLRGILGDAEPSVILVHADGEEAARATLENGQSPTILAVETIGDEAAALWTPYTPASHDLALLQYTSGSTSEPKGVMVSHDNLIANARAMHHALSTSVEDRVVSWLPLYHDMGLMGGLLQPLYSGAPFILMPPQLFLARPMRWLEAISTHRGTVSGGPDFAYRLCVDRIADDAVAALDLSCWELAFSGSETVRADTLNAFAEKFAPAGFDRRAFCPCYGQAEATLFVSGGRRGEGVRATGFDTEKLKGNIAAPAAGDATPIVACGRPQPEHDILIVDPATQAPLPDGRVGEIWFSGPVVTEGYWRRPEATAQTFVLRGAKRYLRSGDLGFFHEGQLHIAGRSKDLIIIRGQNLYPHDIEQCLEREIDLLRNGRIAAFAIERDGREGIGIAAEVSRTAQKLVRPEMLARLISETVAEGFSEPARVVALLNPGGLLRTSSGKLRRGAARQGWEAGTLDCFATFTDGVPAGQAPTSEARKEQEWTPTARRLQTIWGEVLGVDGIDLNASFFMLGGNSIAAVQILTRINEAFGIELEAGALFGSPSLRGLAAAVDEARPRGPSAGAVPILATGGSASVLSYGQRRMWFLRELGGSGAVHHISGGLRLGGALDVAALAAALDQLCDRHEVLRTVLRRLPDGEAEQVIRPHADMPLSVEDLSGLPEAGRQARLEALSAGEARAAFDLERGPLLRATLVRLRAESHVLLLTMHHIISDGWSVRILLGELLRLYDAACRGEDAGLAPPPIRYADYAAWQRTLLEAGAFAPQLTFWRETLGEAAVPLALPFDRPRPAVQSHRGGKLSFAIDTGLASALRRLAGTSNVTLVTLLLAGFKTLLWRYSGERDLRVGLPVAGRNRRETEGVVGLFVNTLVLRGTVEGSMSFADLVDAVRERLIAAQAHQDLPFEQLVETLSPGRSLSHSPLVQVLYNHQPPALGQLPPAGGLAIEVFARDGGGQQFDLVLETEETAEGGLAASFGYAGDLFHETTIARMAGHFTALLAQLVADPAARLDALELVGRDEPAELSAPYPLALTYTHEPIHTLIARRAAERPDAPAVICCDPQGLEPKRFDLARSSPFPAVSLYGERQASAMGEGLGEGVGTHGKDSAPPHPLPLPMGEGAIQFPAIAAPGHAAGLPPGSLSFGALDAEANRLAHHLLAQGIAPEARIAVMLERSPRQIAALLAILKAGAAFLPLDAEQPPARLAQILGDSGASLILTETALEGRLPALGGIPVINLDALDLSDTPASPPDILIHPEQLAYLISTSGSTGMPKAVAVAHGTLSRHCQATGELYEMGPASRELHFISFAFDGAHERWMTPLIFGGAIVLRGPELWSAEETLAAMRRHQVTNAGFPTAYLQQMANWAASDPTPPPPVRLYSFGGEAMPRGGFEAVKRALKPELLINGYGPTEAVISPLAWKVTADAGFEGAYAPIGRAVGERRTYVLDAGLNPVPQGVAGELYVGGDIARGYHARPGLTAERFLPDPFAASGGRMYRTGDHVRQLADGTVAYLGRLDHQLKLRGFRIEPGEIEARLIDHETVSAAAIALHETPAGPRLTGYVVPTPGARPDPAALRAGLARQLPAYMVPARIVAIDAIPLTSTGKIDRARLPIPAPDDTEALVPPASELEAQLAQIWQDTLKIPQIGTSQNFFELGGNSLAALEVLTRIRRLLPERKVTIADLFNNQDIKHLAAALTADAIGSVQIVHLRREGSRPALYCFPGLMVNTREYMPLVRHLGADQPATGFVCYSLTEDAKRAVSVEAIAGHYASHIREHSAGRSCVLLGWSWGGVLAFEAARMLAGEVDVRFVGMLDVINLDVNFAAGTLAMIDKADRARLEARLAAWIDETPMRNDWEALFARMSPEMHTQFLRYLQTVGEALPSDGPGIGSKEYELWTFLDNTLLYQRYRMQPFDVPVHVWNAEGSIKRGLDVVDWRLYTRRVERLEIIPGVTHREIVDAPAFHESFRQSIEAAGAVRA